MAEVMSSLEPGNEDFSTGGGQDQLGASSVKMFPGPNERVPKLSERLPSIVVEPMDSSEVESGELRWPPVETRSAETQEPRRTAPPSARTPPGQTPGEALVEGPDPPGEDQQETD
ncbi:LBH domain-containing protein 2-like [Gadus macrocephalus]|uniref:LBH domain-containing protein 2-like n=1 Tax=Gadus macrocephalus TaxID=80720 RepID=UPI0028CB639F|nr:LBH domain-containing protein 2-like [Gadus macrocephalus]